MVTPLTQLPATFNKLRNLRELCFSGNHFTRHPESMSQLTYRKINGLSNAEHLFDRFKAVETIY